MKKLGTILLVVSVLAAVGLMIGNLAQAANQEKTQTVNTKKAPAAECAITQKVEKMGKNHGLVELYCKKGNIEIARYHYYFDDNYIAADLIYINKFNDFIQVALSPDDAIKGVFIDLCFYNCKENRELCEKAKEQVAYWKNVIKWDKRLKNLLLELKKPENIDNLKNKLERKR